jgi:hypothetical protein
MDKLLALLGLVGEGLADLLFRRRLRDNDARVPRQPRLRTRSKDGAEDD